MSDLDQVDLDIPEPDTNWRCCNQDIPSIEIVFFTQVVVVYIIIITCIINLTLNIDPRDLWITLLSSCLGYILPSPSIQRKKE